MNKKTEKKDGTVYMPQAEVKKQIDEAVSQEELLKKIGDDAVFKHILIKKLVHEILVKKNMTHDEKLAEVLYNRFDKELN